MKEVKVTARAVALFEKESGKTIQEFMDGISEGKMPPISTIALLIKSASKMTLEQSLDLLDEEPSSYNSIVKQYTEWCKVAWSAASSGNSEASTATQN